MKASRALRVAAVLASLVCLAVGCQDAGKRWPGPCKGEWVVREVVEIAGHQFVTPFQQGELRVMTFKYDDQGRLITYEDDDDNDGVIDSRVTLAYDDQGRIILEQIDRGADGVAELERGFVYEGQEQAASYANVQTLDDKGHSSVEVQHGAQPFAPIFSRCFGQCTYDDHGNILTDSDPTLQDALLYRYGCWSKGS